MTAAVGLHVLREELALPLCTLRDGALRANSRALPGFLAALGARCGVDVVLCPHGKTSMIPDLWRRQLDDGCWGITTANAQQTRVAREAGVSRVMVANQLVGTTEIDWIAGELRDEGFAVCCFADSVAGVERLAARIDAAAPVAAARRPARDRLCRRGRRASRAGASRARRPGARRGRAARRARRARQRPARGRRAARPGRRARRRPRRARARTPLHDVRQM